MGRALLELVDSIAANWQQTAICVVHQRAVLDFAQPEIRDAGSIVQLARGQIDLILSALGGSLRVEVMHDRLLDVSTSQLQYGDRRADGVRERLV